MASNKDHHPGQAFVNRMDRQKPFTITVKSRGFLITKWYITYETKICSPDIDDGKVGFWDNVRKSNWKLDHSTDMTMPCTLSTKCSILKKSF